MSGKVINPTIEYQQYMTLWYRYMRFICTVEKIGMLKAIELFGHRFKILYSKKVRFK